MCCGGVKAEKEDDVRWVWAERREAGWSFMMMSRQTSAVSRLSLSLTRIALGTGGGDLLWIVCWQWATLTGKLPPVTANWQASIFPMLWKWKRNFVPIGVFYNIIIWYGIILGNWPWTSFLSIFPHLLRVLPGLLGGLLPPMDLAWGLLPDSCGWNASNLWEPEGVCGGVGVRSGETGYRDPRGLQSFSLCSRHWDPVKTPHLSQLIIMLNLCFYSDFIMFPRYVRALLKLSKTLWQVYNCILLMHFWQVSPCLPVCLSFFLCLSGCVNGWLQFNPSPANKPGWEHMHRCSCSLADNKRGGQATHRVIL